MLHEALLTLWNCPGEILKTTPEEWLNSIELKEFLHPGERKLLQKIMYVAQCYYEIEEFRKFVTSQHTIHCSNSIESNLPKEVKTTNNNNVSSGLYVKAFCNGLDDVLEDYRNEIVDLEGKLLTNPHLMLIYVLGVVEQYSTLFETLKRMICMIQTQKIHGSLLMGRLHMFMDSGIPSVVQATKKIITCVNAVFYRHLCNWIIYGDLVDVCNEFFIGDGNCPDENFMYPGQIAQDIANAEVNQTFRKKRITHCCPVRKFYIKPEMLPSMISLETAETILFIGRIVWIICNDPKKSLGDERCVKFKRDVWNGKAFEYYQKIQQLENYPFNLIQFEKTIEESRLKLTKVISSFLKNLYSLSKSRTLLHPLKSNWEMVNEIYLEWYTACTPRNEDHLRCLWSIVVDEAKLLDHLQLIRDYYALGRGELFQHFIIAAESHLRDMSKDYVWKNLNFIFTECAMKMYGENDRSHLKFELALTRNMEDENTLNPWSCLEINFDVLWPLHIVFHPKIIILYNKLFCFLLRIMKTQIGLHKLWQTHMSSKQVIDRAVWTLRHNLMCLINNIQYYLQVDVIEAEFSKLKEAVNNASEFEDIILQHSKFLSNLLSKTFVMALDEKGHETRMHSLYQLPSLNYENKDTMYSIILLLLEVCDEFCVTASMWGAELKDVEQVQLNELKRRSDALIDMLLIVLYTTHKKVSGPHLLQLLHRLDFNRWYSRNKPDFNLTSV